MSRTTGACSWGLVLAIATSARAGDDLPPLLPPSEAPPALEAPAETTPVPTPAPTPAPVPRPVASRPTTNLLRPRQPAPVRTSPARPPAEATTAPLTFSAPAEAIDGPPPLDGPAEMRTLPIRPGPRTSPRRPTAGAEVPENDGPPSLVLEPAEPDELSPLPDAPRPGTEEDAGTTKKPADEPPSSRRTVRRFGLFSSPRPRTGEGTSIRVEPRSDPAADAALKRRLEAKVKEAVGDRARDIEVRVVDRNVVIRARVDRLWNRRGVRRTIESLPSLAGYRAKVEIDD